MLRKTFLPLLAVLLLALTTSGITPEVLAKGEGGGPGTKEVQPSIDGVLILTSNNFTFAGQCSKPNDVRLIDSMALTGTYDIQTMTQDQLIGFHINGVPTSATPGCYKDNPSTVDLVIKSAKNFSPDGPPGSRSSILVTIVMLRVQ